MSKWTPELGKFVTGVSDDLDAIVRKATFQVFNAVQLRSPVDTGRFRGNWQVTIDAPASGTVTQLDPSGSRAVAEVSKALRYKAGSVVYMTNSLPYARRLEYGYSAQAPGGMVRLSVREFDDAVRRAKP